MKWPKIVIFFTKTLCLKARYFIDLKAFTNKDYYPFGSLMPGRQFSSNSYRFGAFGYEKDDEVKGNGNHYTTKDRAYDSRLGRWFSIDPEAGIFPGWTPYRAFLNNPLYFSDKDGSIEWPLKGTYVIQKNKSEYLTNQQVYSKRKGWGTQTGEFETSLKTEAFQAYFKNPDKNAIIRSSQWNVLRKSTPKQPMTSPHVGTDFRASVGTQVYSLGDGEITALDANSGNLTVKYGNGDLVTFRHLNSIDEGLKVGSKVYEGQGIAKTGERKTTIPHLHVEALDGDGKQVNIEERKYGTVTNEQFFNEYGGDYRKLPGYQQSNRTSPPPIDSGLEGTPNSNKQ